MAIAFSGDTPVQFELDDRLGQQTRIFLADIQINVPIAESRFTFEVPAGVDVIREGDL